MHPNHGPNSITSGVAVPTFEGGDTAEGTLATCLAEER